MNFETWKKDYDTTLVVWANYNGLFYFENAEDTVNNGRTWDKHWVILGRTDFYGEDVFEGLAKWSESDHGIHINNRPPTIIF
jgi:hypothetical protein